MPGETLQEMVAAHEADIATLKEQAGSGATDGAIAAVTERVAALESNVRALEAQLSAAFKQPAPAPAPAPVARTETAADPVQQGGTTHAG
jgi:hypothetical protein